MGIDVRERVPSRTLLLLAAVVVVLSAASASINIGGAHAVLGLSPVARWTLYAAPVFLYLGLVRTAWQGLLAGDPARSIAARRAHRWAAAWLLAAGTLGGYLRYPQAGVGAVILGVVSAGGAIMLLLLPTQLPTARRQAVPGTGG